MASSALDRLRSLLRGAVAACALGFIAAVAHAFAALALAGPLTLGAEALAHGEVPQRAVAIGEQGLLQAVIVVAVCLLARLLIELPRSVGAGAGLFAIGLPALVLAVGEGVESLGPGPLLAVRAAAALLCAIAGWAALRKRR